MEIKKKWEKITPSFGVHPTLILLKSKDKFNSLEDEKKYEKGASLQIKEKLNNLKNKYLVSDSQWKTSISHTKGMVFGVGLKVFSEIIGIGIDAEDEKRKVSQAAFHRFTSEEEREKFPHLDPIRFWILKESAFKSNPQSKETLISDYFIDNESEEYFIIRNQKNIFFNTHSYINRFDSLLISFSFSFAKKP